MVDKTDETEPFVYINGIFSFSSGSSSGKKVIMDDKESRETNFPIKSGIGLQKLWKVVVNFAVKEMTGNLSTVETELFGFQKN